MLTRAATGLSRRVMMNRSWLWAFLAIHSERWLFAAATETVGMILGLTGSWS